MGTPLRMNLAVGKYLITQKIFGRKKYPIVLMLEPLFACNLTCAGCGKIQHPPEVLAKRMTPEECWAAAEECGAPIVTVAGGEPLMHPDIERIVSGLIQRGKFVILCTNALLLEKSIHKFKPSSQFIFSIHLDGLEETHDRVVCRKGVYQNAVKAIRFAKSKGFCVMTNTTVYDGEKIEDLRQFFEECKALKLDGMTISPGFAYEKAPDQDLFLGRERTKAWFREALRGWRQKKWPLNHSPFYIDFLQGRREYHCTAWGNPVRHIFGWQKPCYLIGDGGNASTYRELLETTEWSQYGHHNKNPKCVDCMAHVGFEPSAVNDMFAHPIQALKSAFGWGKEYADEKD